MAETFNNVHKSTQTTNGGSGIGTQAVVVTTLTMCTADKSQKQWEEGESAGSISEMSISKVSGINGSRNTD